MMESEWNFKGHKISIMENGRFQTTVNNDELVAESLEALKKKITAKMKEKINRFRVFYTDYDERDFCQGEVTSIAQDEYSFGSVWIKNQDGHREKVDIRKIFLLKPEVIKQVKSIQSDISGLTKKKDALLDSIRIDDNKLFKLAGIKREAHP